MTIDLDRKDLEALIRGSQARYEDFDNPLVKKAGHFYSDQYGRTSWHSLSSLEDEELYRLYLICKRLQ